MQETISFTLPVTNKTVVIRGYVSGRIDYEVSKALKDAMSVDFDPSTGEVVNTVHIPLSVQDAANMKALELMVVSVDGDTTDVYNKVLDLPAADTLYVVEQVNKVTNAAKIDEKKSSNSQNSTS